MFEVAPWFQTLVDILIRRSGIFGAEDHYTLKQARIGEGLFQELLDRRP